MIDPPRFAHLSKAEVYTRITFDFYSKVSKAHLPLSRYRGVFIVKLNLIVREGRTVVHEDWEGDCYFVWGFQFSCVVLL